MTEESTQDPQGTGGGNPAWNDFLEYVPEERREEVTPLLQQWDRGVQDKIQKVHQEYEPWKPIVGSGYDPETVAFGTELLSTLQSDPRKLYDALAENYGFNTTAVEEEEEKPPSGSSSGQGQQEAPNLPPEVMDRLQKMDIMEQILLKQRENELIAQEEAALDKALNDLRTKHGDYDEQDVVMRLATNPDLTPEEALNESFAYADKIRSSRPVPPRIMGGGSGAIPSASIDPGKMSDKDVRKLVTQTLQNQIMEG